MKTNPFESFDLPALPLSKRHGLLLSAVAPRPIALVGSLDASGRPNLSPFSFFNAFGANPCVIAVSPAYSGRTGLPKHTHQNILATKEFTVSAVSYELVDQINLASSEYEAGVDEWIKAGLSKHPSQKIAAPGVSESPCILECRLMDHVDLGGQPGSGNLLIAEVLTLHVKREVLTPEGQLDPRRLDLVARMGSNWYTRSKDGLFELPKPGWSGIGFDQLPARLLKGQLLTASSLAKLASIKELPPALRAGSGPQTAKLSPEDEAEFVRVVSKASPSADRYPDALEQKLEILVRAGELERAWSWIVRQEMSR